MDNKLDTAATKAAQAGEMLLASVTQFEHFLTLFLNANTAYIEELKRAAGGSSTSGSASDSVDSNAPETFSPVSVAPAVAQGTTRPGSALHSKLKACEEKISRLEESLASNALAGEAARFAKHQLASLRGSKNKLLKRISAEGQSAGGAKWKPRLNK